MKNTKLMDALLKRETSITLKHLLDNSKADSGGMSDVHFLDYLVDNGILIQQEAVLKRTSIDFREEYYSDKYKKMNYESDRHFYCRVIIQEELTKLGFGTFIGISTGNMQILHKDSSYDITADDFSFLVDIGLTPARNFFRGLTDLKVKNYFITSYFDDYMDDIIFSVFSRRNDEEYLTILKDYEDGFNIYKAGMPLTGELNVNGGDLQL